MEANVLHVVCGVCGEATGDYSKTAIQVTVKSGKLRIRTWLCSDCMAKAEDAQEESAVWQVHTTDPAMLPTDLRLNKYDPET